MQVLNMKIGSRLEEVARLLEQQGANPFRIHAYRRAARTLRRLDYPISELVKKEGIEGLQKLEGIGPHLAQSISQLIQTGQLPMLARLRGGSDPVELLKTVPGIGSVTAERLYSDLGIHSLEDLEVTAYDGRLSNIEGFGEKRLIAVRDSLWSRLNRVSDRSENRKYGLVPVDELLQVDAEYRSKAKDKVLPRISPRRFNPEKKAWLPILHTMRGKRHYTALFSNTALAHRLDKTKDWVILYFENGVQENQCTVVTAYNGPLKGKRIVRGRESECLQYYRNQNRAEHSAQETRFLSTSKEEQSHKMASGLQ
jgi:hypothetical protein